MWTQHNRLYLVRRPPKPTHALWLSYYSNKHIKPFINQLCHKYSPWTHHTMEVAHWLWHVCLAGNANAFHLHALFTSLCTQMSLQLAPPNRITALCVNAPRMNNLVSVWTKTASYPYSISRYLGSAWKTSLSEVDSNLSATFVHTHTHACWRYNVFAQCNFFNFKVYCATAIERECTKRRYQLSRPSKWQSKHTWFSRDSQANRITSDRSCPWIYCR